MNTILPETAWEILHEKICSHRDNKEVLSSLSEDIRAAVLLIGLNRIRKEPEYMARRTFLKAYRIASRR